jgi:uncharacterized repeat protein (TIGR01451 family)
MVDSFASAGDDADSDGKTDPGDTITYTATINNSGTDATGVMFTDTIDLHTSLVLGSVFISPLAINESYNSVGNMTLDSNLIGGNCGANSLWSVTCNDTLNGGALTGFGQSQGTANNTTANGTNTVTTTNGGTVLLRTNGTFLYNPAAGFEGTDTFWYTLTNSSASPVLTDNAQVSITVGGANGVVWFVNNGVGGTNVGTQANPFTLLSTFNGANNGAGSNPNDGDTVFLFESGTAYVGPVTLRTSQKLIGQDATVSVSTLGGPSAQPGNVHPATNPTGANVNITSASAGITLGSTNNIAGFSIGNSTTAITGGAVGTLKVREVGINTNGSGLIISTSGTITSDATFTGFTGITSTGGTNGISLTGVGGTLNTTGSLSGASGATFNISGGTVSVTYSGNITQANNAAMVFIGGGHTTGTITFQTGTLSATNGTGLQFDNADSTTSYNFNGTTTLSGGDAGVDILNGSSGTFSFGSNTSISNPSSIAFNVNASAPASLSYAGSITANGSRALSISNAAAAGCGTQTFSGSINGSGASATGVLVNNCNTGTINFSGTTLTLSTQANSALTLTGNAGATINFSGGNMALTTSNGNGIAATGGGAVNITGNDNTISTTGSGLAVNWAMLTGVHSSGTLRFKTINKSGSGSKAILVNYHDGSFTVTGDDDNNGTPDSLTAGGTITGTTTRGAEFIDVDGGVALAGMTFTNATTVDGTAPTDCGAAFETAGNKNCNAPIYFDTVINASLHTVDVNGSLQTGIIGYDVTGLTMNTVTARNGGDNIAENGGAAFKNLRGTTSVSNSSFKDNTRAQFDITNNAGTTAGNISFLNNEFTGNRSPNLSAQGLLIVNGGTMGTVSIGDGTAPNDNNFHDSFSNGFQYAGRAGATSATININRNSFSNTNSGIVLQVAGVGVASTLDYAIESNTIVAGSLTGSGAIITSATQGHLLDGLIRSNTIGTSGVANSGAVCNSCNGITVDHDGFGRHDVSIIGNTVQRVKSIGIYYQVVDASGNVFITGNLVREPEGNPSNGIFVQSGTVGTDDGCVAVTLGGTVNDGFPSTTANAMNSVQGTWDPAGSQSEIFVWRRFATVMNLPGLSGAADAWVAARNNIPDANGPDVTAIATPFGSAASCPLLLELGGISRAMGPAFSLTSFDYHFSVLSSSVVDDSPDDFLNPAITHPSDKSEVTLQDLVPPGVPAALKQEQLNSVISTALQRWIASGLTNEQIASLRAIKFEITDLANSYLGEADGNRILVDRDAGGQGWFIDSKPLDDESFAHAVSATRRYTDSTSAPAGRVDLLTAIGHEMGHKLGLGDSYAAKDRDSLMYGYLTVGERRLPAPGQAKVARPGALKGSHFLSLGRDDRTRAEEPKHSVSGRWSLASMLSGDLVTANIGNLPAGKSVTVQFKVTLDNPPNLTLLNPARVSNQGSVNYTGNPGAAILTDDTAVGGAADPTETLVDLFNSVTILGTSHTTTTSSQTITFTANVAVDGTNVPQPSVPTTATGTVTFKDNGSDIGTCTNLSLSSGSVQCMTTLPGAGSPHSITAVYNGDGNYDTSTSSAQVVTIINPPTIVKSFVPASTPLGSTPTMRFVVTNPNSSTTLNGIAFSDTTPQGITVGTNTGAACNGGTMQTTAGHSVIFSGGMLAGGASCTIDVGVGSVEAGDWPNTTGPISSTETGAGATSNTATLTIVAPPVIAKAFSPTNTSPGGGSTLTFTITNPSVNTVGLTGVAFTDNLPAGIKVAATPNVQPAVSPCGGTVTAVANSGQITLAGGMIATNSFCTISVDVTATTGGLNQVQVTSTNGGTGNTASASLITCVAPPANMVAWWTGDTTTRDIAGGNDAMLNGNAAYGTGKVLQGFSLDGTGDFVEAPDSNSLDITTAITIDAWINPTNAAANGRIVDKITPGNTDGYLLDLVGGNLRFISGTINVQTAAVIPQNTFTHVAVTYDGANVVLYINGAAVSTTPATGAIPVNALPLRIGAAQNGTFAMAGVIDEVEIFNDDLSAAQILAIFTADAGGKCKPSDLKITKTHTDPFIQGSTGNNYTITVHNDGPAATTGTVTVVDTLPAGLTPTAPNGAHNGWNCTIVSQTVTCDRSDTLASGADYPTITLTVTAGVNTPSVTNNVTVSGGGEMDTSDDTASDLTNLTPVADLLAVKIDSPDPVTASTNITYSLTLTNNGPSDAQAVTLTDGVPANTTFVSAIQNTGPTFLCTNPPGGGTGNVSCSIATLAAGATATFTMVVNVNANTPESTIITNNAVAASATGDSNSLNNTGTAMTTVNQSDIEITSQTDTPDPVEAGSNITYTVNFKNNSAVNTASNLTVTDAVPSGTTLVSATTASPGWARTDVVPAGGTGNIVFSKALVATAETAVFTIVVKVNASVPAGTVITNTATATTTSIDNNSANNSATATTTTEASADLEVTSQTDTPDPVIAGENITYTITVLNNGPSDAQTVTVTDALPANTTFVSAAIATGTGWTIPSPPAVGGTGNVVFSKSTVAAAETASFTVVVKVNANTPAATIISNDAVAASATTDPAPGNNTDTATTTVSTSGDLSVTKVDSPDPVTVGGNLTYTVTVTNNGSSDAQNLSLSDTLPLNTTFVSFTVPGGWIRTDIVPVGGSGTVTATAPTLPAGAGAVFTLVVNVNLATPHNTLLTNSATVTTTTSDPNLVNNTGTTTTTVNSTLALTVNDSGDAADNNLGDRICDTSTAAGDQCSLRAAIQETNAAVTADTIDFSLPANSSITLLSALDDINGDLVITGPASSVTVNGNNLYRVFRVVAGNVRLLNLTITNGRANQGGGIFNSGNLTISNSTFTGNNAVGGTAEGGAIYSNSGTLTILNSTISGNTANGSGGGLFNGGTSTATLVNVTVTNNRTDADGVVPGPGGGIAQTSSNPVTLDNTIVAGNFTGVAPGTAPDEISGNMAASSNNNLVGAAGFGGLLNGVNFNQVGVPDARLGLLTSNGGPTQTHALLAGSVALDAGDNTTATNAGLTTDQRGSGFNRTADGPDADAIDSVDIGAFEAQVWMQDILDRSLPEDGSDSFSFKVGGSAAITTVTATSSNTALVPNNATNLNVSGSGPTRTLTINPLAEQNGSTIITVTVNSASGSMTDTFVLTVWKVNDAPSANNDTIANSAEDAGPRTILGSTLTANDSKGPANESGQTLIIKTVSNPIGGTVSIVSDNVVFTPTADYNGPAGFQYTAEDNGATNSAADSKPSGTATVNFNITEVNDAPNAVDDALSTGVEDSSTQTIPIAILLANDTKGPANESSQTLTLTGVSSPVGGTVTNDGSNVYFTPAADFNGVASFQYTLTDNGTTNGAADPKNDTATVNFTITEVNDAPKAMNDPLGNMEEDAPQRTIPFSALTNNDSRGAANESGQTLIVKTVSNPIGLTVSIVAGTVRFTPLPDYNGPASFRYTVEDNGTTNGVADPKSDGPALAHFNITEVNDVPVAVNDTLPGIVEDSGPQTIPFSTLTNNDSKGPANESSQTLIVKTVSNPVGGTVSIVGGNVVFTPTANYFGPASFDYTVEDNGTTNGVANPKTSGTATVTFANSAVADTPSVTNATTNANTQTTSGLVISRNPADGAEVTHFKITAITGGSLFKNDGVTPINNGDFITFAEGNAGLKFTPGATNGSFLVQASLGATDAGLGGGTVQATIIVNPLGGVIRFSAANYSVAESAGLRTITVERSGDTSQAVTVDYASSDHSNPADFVPCTASGAGQASSRCDFTTALGTLRFAAGETSKTFNLLISNDNYVEGTETLDLTLSNPQSSSMGGAVLGVPSTAVLSILDDLSEPPTNPIDNAADFVKAQYRDILGREPDAPGLAFWTDNLEKCNDSNRRPSGQTMAQCIDKQSESTAIAFFMSPEFQMTGGFVYHLYKGSLTGTPNYDGGSPNSSPGRFPTFLEFMRDMGQVSERIVVNNQISGAVVEANRNALATAFVQRPEFVAKYGGLNNTLYVQELFNTTGIAAMAAQKQALVDGLTNATETRASVLRKVVDGTVVISESNVQFTTPYGQAFINQENRRLFVYLEYIGYLRRNPDTAGFVFWLGKLNQFSGHPFQAEMVRSFILSPEYRSRFGQP